MNHRAKSGFCCDLVMYCCLCCMDRHGPTLQISLRDRNDCLMIELICLSIHIMLQLTWMQLDRSEHMPLCWMGKGQTDGSQSWQSVLVSFTIKTILGNHYLLTKMSVSMDARAVSLWNTWVVCDITHRALFMFGVSQSLSTHFIQSIRLGSHMISWEGLVGWG